MAVAQQRPEATDRGARPSRRRTATRSRLIDAAAEVFAEVGFGRATVEDVCDRAGYSRGAFYSNFASLDELFFALYAARAAELVTAVADAVAHSVTVGPDLAAAGHALDELVEQVVAVLPTTHEHHLLNLEFLTHALRHPAVAAALADHRAQLRAALRPVLRQGLGTAGVELDEQKADGLARAVIAVHEGISSQELLEPDDPALPRLRRQLLSGLLGGRPQPSGID